MVLFVCYTNLQLVIASRIIAEKRMSPLEVEVFYISKVNNDVTRNTLNDIRGICSSVTFMHMKFKYPLYFIPILMHFFSRRYSSIYVASIDNIIIHFILSRVSFDCLYTFDDGSANILPNSIYYQESELGVISFLCRRFLRIRYDILSIKQLSKMHYTIYDDYPNIIKDVTTIHLTSPCEERSINNSLVKKEYACNVFIGSVYSELFTSGCNTEDYLNRCWRLLMSTGIVNIYFPHPRENSDVNISGIKKYNMQYIAEKEIEQLLKKYEKIFLYGFLSSCQINLSSNPDVVNRVFYSKQLKPVFINAMKSHLYSSFEVINIDDERQ